MTVVLVAFQNFKRVLCSRDDEDEEPKRSASQLNKPKPVENGKVKEKENNINLLNRKQSGAETTLKLEFST